MQRNYENLANAIVLQAARDYRQILRWMRQHPDSKRAKSDAAALERFFHSQWYELLTNLDGDVLIAKLREEVLSE